jgi:hypothetical protein
VVELFDPRRLARRDLRRLVSELWGDERCDGIAPVVLDAAIAADAKSLDRAVLTAYLRHFPADHPSFERLRAASALGAGRRDWPWRLRGETWQLWDAQAGPERLASALLSQPDAHSVLRDAGFDGDLAQSEFVADALEAACEKAADTKGDAAVQAGERLIGLFEQLAISGTDAMLAWALLAPWLDRQPPDAYRDRLAKLLVTRIGDPRLQRARWEALTADMRDPEAPRLVAMVRRWLTQRTVRQFFTVVGSTTNDPKQWAAREEFWLAYLDDGAIDDAWFAFGRQADALADGGVESGSDLLYGEITGSGADASHSALLMSIGDVRIAEWSHNGSCRFWDQRDRQAPQLYRKQYFGMALRAMNGSKGFEDRFAAIPHASGWQVKFAGFIHHFSGRNHPLHGSGIGWNGGYRSSAIYGQGGGTGWG